MERLTAYCDLDFLDLFYCLEPEGPPSEFDDDDRSWLELHDFLRASADLVVVAEDEELHELLEQRPYLRHLINPIGRSTSTFDPTALEGVGTADRHGAITDVWSVYFLDGTTDPKELQRRFGVWSSAAGGAREDWRRLGRDVAIPVGRAEVPRSIATFADLAGRWDPISEIVVADKYLFSKKEHARDNLFSLLIALIGDGCEELEAEVVLVGNHDESWSKDADEIHSWVMNELCPPIDEDRLCLTVALVNNAIWRKRRLHDRRLFLSYGYVRSGDSINSYFRGGKPSASSHLAFRSLADPDTFALAMSELRDVASAVKDTPKMLGIHAVRASSGRSRLIEVANDAR